MKVEIVEIRRKIVDIGPCDDSEIDEKVVDAYNALEDKDYNFANTEMYYNVFPRDSKELGVQYRTLDLAKFIIYHAYRYYGGVTLPMLCTIMYLLYEDYLKKGIRLFDASFISYKVYPKEEAIYDRYCVYAAATKIMPINEEDVITVSTEVLDDIRKYLNLYADKNLGHVHDILKGTVYEGMVCAGALDKRVEI